MPGMCGREKLCCFVPANSTEFGPLGRANRARVRKRTSKERQRSMPRQRQRAVTAAFLLLAVLLLTGCDKIRSKQEIKKGNEFLKAAQYQSALAAYEEALRLDPAENKLHKHIGIAYMGMYTPGLQAPQGHRVLPEGHRQPEAVRPSLSRGQQDARVPDFDVSEHRALRRRDRLLPERVPEAEPEGQQGDETRWRCCTSRKATSTTASSG